MSLQAIIRFFLPKEDQFYDYLERQAKVANEGAVALAKFRDKGMSAADTRTAVQVVEHAGDKIMHDMEEALARTFVTPIDREDLQKLSSQLDDILDLMNASARACVLLGVSQPSKPMCQLMEKLMESTKLIEAAVPHLRKHTYGELLTANHEIRRVEKEADVIYRDGLQALFHNENDAKVILREKEVLETLEHAIDYAERVGDTLANLAIKHG